MYHCAINTYSQDLDEILKFVRLVFVEIVCFESHANTSTVDSHIKTTKFLLSFM